MEDMAHLICRGGWPEAVLASESADSYAISKDHIRAVAEEDIDRIDGVQRNAEYALLIMGAYARSVGTQATMSTMRSLIMAQKTELSRGTVDAYVAALRKLYVFEDLEAWKPSLRDKTRTATTPTRHFVDPYLAAAAMGASPATLLKDLPTMGMLFESNCVRDLRICAEHIGGSVFHYHDDAGREADAVIVLDDGRWALVEVEMGSSRIEEGAKSLINLSRKIDATVMGEASFLMVMAPVQYAYQRPDGVVVVPPTCLMP